MQWQLLDDFRQLAAQRPTLAAHLNMLKRPFRRTLIWISLLEILKIVYELPYKFLIDNLSHQNGAIIALSFCAMQSLVEMLQRTVFVIGDTYRNAFVEGFKVMLFAEGHRKELELSMDWHAKHGTGEKEAIIAKNIEKVLNLFAAAIFDVLPTGLLIFFTSLSMYFLGWQYLIIALGTLILYIAALFWIEPKLAPMRDDYRVEERTYEMYGSEITQQVKTIKGFGLERLFLGRLDELLSSFYKNEVPRHRKWLLQLSIPEMVLSASKLLVQVLGIYLIYRRAINMSSFILAVIWMAKVFSNYNRLTQFQHRLQHGLPAVKELLAILKTEPTVQQPAAPVWRDDLSADIELRDVSFRYAESGCVAVDAVNLTIRRNSVVAIIGKSGSGKTTLADLLTRTCDPTSGTILMGGIDLRTLDYQRFRGEFCAVVHQNASLFDTTIRENIRISDTSAAPGSEVEAARMAYADEFIDPLPCGYETLVGENGVRLSGGQKQRISIARALHRSSKLLVLDEPTSALDGGSQQKVKLALTRLTGARKSTIVIIAHRFSTIEMADEIVVMDKGKIVETGTHAELIKLNGFYARLRQLENEGALDEEDPQAVQQGAAQPA